MSPKKTKPKYEEPAMSDNTLLIRVDDLIAAAMGPAEINKVNFKLLQSILEILARQLRMLETEVEIRVSDLEPEKKSKKKGSPKHNKEGKHKGKAQTATPKAEKEENEKKQEKDKEATGGGHTGTRVGSIEVVTLSQFALLEASVKDLEQKTGPPPAPALPDNQQLRADIVKGTASLTDTMEAMQVTARVKAAEQAIGRMAGLLTQLAAAGALPENVADMLGGFKIDAEDDAAATGEKPVTPRKSVAIDPKSTKASGKSTTSTTSAKPRPSVASGAISTTSRVSTLSSAALPKVTKTEMEIALETLKENLTKNVNNIMNKASAAADAAAITAKAVSDKLNVALKLNARISTLHTIVSDYAEQLNGFDAGLSSQLQSFQQQMVQIRSDLKGGLALLDQANNNGENAAITELTERFQDLVMELDHTMSTHGALTAFQKQLGGEMHTLLECVEIMREQKSDRDEVADGLRDKADMSRLAGLLTEQEFGEVRSELERRLDLCHDKFNKQERTWMHAMKDLSRVAEGKADIMQLLGVKDDTEKQLRELQDKVQKLSVALGEPTAAMMTRQLSRGGTCGSCLTPALMKPMDISFGAPPPLPAMRTRPTGAPDEPCLTEWKPKAPPDNRKHACLRWVGGSHTLLSEAVTREQAAPLQISATPTKRYTGYGSDGRLYMLEEELRPCLECNILSDKLSEEVLPNYGAGDAGMLYVEYNF